MRALTLPRWDARILGPLAVCSLAAAMAGGLLWATWALEGKWLMAVVVGLSLFGLAVISGRFERFLQGLLIFIIPFNADIHWHPPFEVSRGTPLLGMSVMDLILGCLYALWIARLLADRRSLRSLWPSGATALVCLIAWGALSLINAQNVQLSLFLLVGLTKAFLLFFYLANNIRTRENLLLVVRCLIAGLLVESLLTLAQYAVGSNLGLDALGEQTRVNELELGGEKAFRPGGTLGHPNFLAGYLASVLPLVLALSLSSLRTVARLATGGTLVLGAVALVLTLSRSAWLSAAVACAPLMGRLLGQRRQRSRLLLVLFLALVCGVMLAPFAPHIAARWFEDDQGAAASRIPKARVAWSIITSHPILGVGLNNYSTVSHQYQTSLDERSPHKLVLPSQGSPHNLYLLLAAEMGLMSLVWLGWFLWVVARRGWQAISAVKNEEALYLILLGITFGLFARLVHDAAHTGHLSTNTFFWVYSALLVARKEPTNA